jgi:hypothetical protein
MTTRKDYEEILERWRGMGWDIFETTHSEDDKGVRLASGSMSTRADDALRLAREVETQASLHDEVHYSRSRCRHGQVTFWLYLSRPVDEQDAIPVAVQP